MQVSFCIKEFICRFLIVTKTKFKTNDPAMFHICKDDLERSREKYRWQFIQKQENQMIRTVPQLCESFGIG